MAARLTGANAKGEAAAAATAAAAPTNRRRLRKVFCIKALPPRLFGPQCEPTTWNADCNRSGGINLRSSDRYFNESHSFLKMRRELSRTKTY
ncbi:hypothetical protein [Streptomyces hydrogenans]|uniref:hypothetical protein n=1 Tax=Streptomyces hydrogenans TaxID=1873719 RepID=UPI0035DD9A28